MLLASKYEEMYAPEVADFVYITDNAYTKKEILEMEGTILRALNFSFGRPLCLHFLRRNSKAGQVKYWLFTIDKPSALVYSEQLDYDETYIHDIDICQTYQS